MTVIELMPDVPALGEDELVQLHLRIAQRADELARWRPGLRDHEFDLECWREAEREILSAPDA